MLVAQIVSAVALICYIILIVATLHNHPRRRESKAFALYLLAMLVWQFAALMVGFNETANAALFWYRIMIAGMGATFILYAIFIIVFLDGKVSPRVALLGWTIIIALIASSSTDLVIPSVARSPLTYLHVPNFGILIPPVAMIAYSFLGYGIYRLVRGYRNTKSSKQRERIKYLLLGSLVIAIGALSNLIPSLQDYPIDVTANLINALLIAYAIGRHKLLDITVVVRKGLLYSIPTAIIGMIYLLLIALAIGVFNVSGLGQIAVSLLVAIVIALVAQPLQSRAQNWVDRFFFREKFDSSLMLERVSRTAAYEIKLDELTNMILAEVTRTIHIQKAAFFLKREKDEKFLLTANRGYTSGETPQFRSDHPIIEWLKNHDHALMQSDMDLIPYFKSLLEAERGELRELGAELYIPIKAKGELVGIFIVGPKRSEESYSHDDQLTLTMLANQTAVAIENARLYWHLERTLEALRQAHDELEIRVEHRTQDLEQANKALEAEIKERLRAEKEIKRYTKELERSNQELQQFAYVASHDLNEPLRMVTSYLQLLERRYDSQLTSEAKEFIAFAVDGAKRMQTLISDLLAYSRVGAQGKPFQPVELAEIVNQSTTNLSVAIAESQATVSWNSLPIVNGDPIQLIQLFQNLIGNAIKFKGDRTPNIEIREAQHNGMCRISVSDNGIGIEPEYAERIFLIFQRLHNREEYPGNGIGLAICKRIAERHGGQIWVESQPGEGTTFCFTLPASQEGAQ